MISLNMNAVNIQGAFPKGSPSQIDMYRKLTSVVRIEMGHYLPVEVPMLFGFVGALLVCSKTFLIDLTVYFTLFHCFVNWVFESTFVILLKCNAP